MASKDDKPTSETAKDAKGAPEEAKSGATVTGKAPPPPTIELTAKEVTPDAEAEPEKSAPKPAAKPAASRKGRTTTKPAADKAEKTETPSTAKPEAKAESKPTKAEPKDDTKPQAAAAAKPEPARPTTEPKEPPPPPPAASGGGNGFGVGLAAIAGGVIGAGVLYALMAGQVLPLPGAGSDDGLAETVAAVETRVDALSSTVQQAEGLARTEDLEALRGEIAAGAGSADEVAALRAELDGITAALTELPISEAEGALVRLNADLAGVTERLAMLEAAQGETAASVTALGERAAAPAPEVDLTGIESRLTALESGTGEAVAVDTSRLDALDAAVAELTAEAGAVAAITARLETGAGEVSEAVAAATAGADAAGAGLAELSDRLDAALAAANDRLDATDAALQAVQEDVETLAARDHAIDDERRAAMVSAIAGLERAAQGSGPFAREVEAVRAVAGETEALAALDPFAATGVPSVTVLATRFADLAGPIIDAGARAGADTVLSRLAANAQTLVRVRPTGFVAGDSDPAKVARIEALLGEGKVEPALAEWESLSEAAKAASADWAEDARRRVALDAALAGLAAMPG